MKVTETKNAEESEQSRIRNSPIFQNTPAQIEAYIDGFTDINDAKVLLKELTKAVRQLAKRI